MHASKFAELAQEEELAYNTMKARGWKMPAFVQPPSFDATLPTDTRYWKPLWGVLPRQRGL